VRFKQTVPEFYQSSTYTEQFFGAFFYLLNIAWYCNHAVSNQSICKRKKQEKYITQFHESCFLIIGFFPGTSLSLQILETS
jgi:hypothetical protein